jgi:hypothetical protein
MVQTLMVTVDPLAVEALRSADDAEREAAWSELTLVAASAMAEIHAGLHRWMTERLGLSADDARAVIGDAMSEHDPLDETLAESVTVRFEEGRVLNIPDIAPGITSDGGTPAAR